jgi:manganese/zinc-transporting P-type ATPase C
VAERPSVQEKGRKSTRQASFSSSRVRSIDSSSCLLPAQPVVRIAPGADGVSIWNSALFGDPASPYLREFLARAFSVEEVAAVEIHRAESRGRVHYRSSANPAEIWRKLSGAMGRSNLSDSTLEASTGKSSGFNPQNIEGLYLDGPQGLPIWVNRVGATLSTWRLRYESEQRIRLTHPILISRPDVAYRLEEELTAILGVEDFRTSTLTASVAVRWDPRLLTAERLVRRLEQSWPRLIDGLEGPPSAKRFAFTGGLLALSFTGQYVAPALKPLGLLAVTLYGLPNVKTAARQLVLGQVGLPALYSFGLGLMLIAGRPFSSSVKAVMMQIWPRWTHKAMTRSQRRLFAIHRQRATWARKVQPDGLEYEVDIDALTVGDLIAVHAGDSIPVDGVVTEGLAAVDEEALSGAIGAFDKTPGDPVFAATFVRDGRLTLRVERIGVDTVAGFIGAHLPHSKIDNLLSSAEAERIANRNARPALAAAALSLVVTRSLHPTEAIARPDYATGPRLSAQFSALHDLGDGLRRGILFRDPAALDRLTASDVYVFDEAATLERRQIEVAEVIPANNVSADAVLAHTAAAFPISQNERASALQAESGKRGLPTPEIFDRERHAGAIRYRDSDDHLLEIAAPAYVAALGISLPASIAEAVHASPHAWDPRRTANESIGHEDPLLRPLWVLRDGEVFGVITFRRHGEPEGVRVIAELKARNQRARFVYISSHAQATADRIAEAIGISTVFGDLDPAGKARAIRQLGGRTLWIGDGTSTEAIPSIEASTVSISVAGISTAPVDGADIVLLQPGLQNLVPLRRIGRRHRATLEADYRTVYAANLLAVAGGFFANFGSLESGLTSNLGTAYIYLKHRSQLRDLISRVEKRRAIVLSPSREESDHLAHTLHIHADGVDQFVDYRDLDASVRPGSELHGV